MAGMFKVRNLLIHVLPMECQMDSCGFDSGCELDEGSGGCEESLDCEDTGGCGDTGDCDGDSGGCDGGDDSGGCDGGDDSGECDGGDNSGGCDGGDNSGGCDGGDDSGCAPDSGCVAGGNTVCPAGDNTGCAAADSGCAPPDQSACATPPLTDCGMGMRTPDCDIVKNSDCDVGISPCLPLLQDSRCVPPVITDACGEGNPTNCDVLVAVTNPCPGHSLFCLVAISPLRCPPNTNVCAANFSPVIIAAQPAALCFRSDEPKLNPNSLVDLGVMRRQLTAYLKIIQLRERALARALTPKTPRQIQAAEAILDRALRDLKTRKQFVQARAVKKPASAAKKASPSEPVNKKGTAKRPAPKKGRRKP